MYNIINLVLTVLSSFRNLYRWVLLFKKKDYVTNQKAIGRRRQSSDGCIWGSRWKIRKAGKEKEGVKILSSRKKRGTIFTRY